ncbi:small multi-drug export protein [Methanobacterium sp.]|uniref:small multi-drug export protein n=1 Tax=Methanobacterium sp. TaxID=2164 RepID=UPI002ABAC61E|nr:small multi-drug export protein [Methanobacterium sp.]MDY9924515.1 small multi-drug export protein [Methanobacterium sp.]
MNLESILVIFAASVAELWVAIPLGLVMKINPIIIATVSAAGAIFAAVCVTLLGDNLRTRLLKWKYDDEEALKKTRLYNVWNKYGVIGLGLLSPLIFGAPLGAAVGIALGARKNGLLLWMSIGIIIWSIGLTVAGSMGLLALEKTLAK